ncbi:MAG: DedA family protein [Leptolyngbya sp. SIO4C1]|nr:DedA family protein [Leptolyngbya sp. SIO4C1]
MSSELFSLEMIQAIAREYGYWAVFFGIMLENMGLPLPGETVTLVGGFLAGSDELRYSWVLLSAIAGAVLGDNFGYWLGFYGGWPLLLRLGKLLRLEETKLIRVRDQFSQNADKAVILGRFVALLRIFAGPLAGIAKMPYWKFLLCNFIGAGLWAAVMVSLAFFVGSVIPLATLVGWVAQFAVLALAAVVAWVGLFWWLESRQSVNNS